MVLNISPELAEKIQDLANARGQGTEQLLTEIVARYTSEDTLDINRQDVQGETIEQTVDRVIGENKQLLDALASR